MLWQRHFKILTGKLDKSKPNIEVLALLQGELDSSLALLSRNLSQKLCTTRCPLTLTFARICVLSEDITQGTCTGVATWNIPAQSIITEQSVHQALINICKENIGDNTPLRHHSKGWTLNYRGSVKCHQIGTKQRLLFEKDTELVKSNSLESMI